MNEILYRLHAMGFALHWLYPRKKNPVETAWSEGPRKTLEELTETYVENYNVGVRLGEPSHLVDGTYLHIVDCDLKSEDPNHKLELEIYLDKFFPLWKTSPKVLSGRRNGSFHLYFKSVLPLSSRLIARSSHFCKVKMKGAPSSRDAQHLTKEELLEGYKYRPAWEVELLGTKKQAAIPPSVHPDSGLEYVWDFEMKSVEDIPLINSEELMREIVGTNGKGEKLKDFKPVDYDIFKLNLSNELFDKIATLKGLELAGNDRSNLLFSVILHLVKLGMKDQLILSILTDRQWDLAAVAYDHAKSESQTKAARWLWPQILKARSLLDPKNEFVNEVKDIVLTEKDQATQEKDFLDALNSLRTNDKGEIKPSLFNTRLLVNHMQMDCVVLGFNEFINKEVLLSKPPWDLTDDFKEVRTIQDSDYVAVKYYISSKFQMEPRTDTIKEVIVSLARENKFHPIRNYLNGLKWDGLGRLDTWLIKYMSAEDTLFNRAVGAKTLIAAVQRVFRPGCKFDQVLILEGPQGIGKSRTLRALGGKYFSDTLGDLSNKDTVQGLQGNWIIEVGELSHFRKSEVTELKEFISRQVDQIRPAYGHNVQEYPRQCIFIGTTNEDVYLKDETGNRRFWPVKVNDVFVDQIEKDRDQLWAEAMARYQMGEAVWLESDELQEAAREAQDERYMRDERAESVTKWINNELKLEGRTNFFTMEEVVEGAFLRNFGDTTKSEQAVFAKMFREAGLHPSRKYDGKMRIRGWKSL